eukprot:maker-scaffold1323_size47899-snap-gene-0.11 protein:Tk03419 transcript:maker-scaffold1323_size47899-snap-gene-0.11-mRNA-1 annotation:"hypothetical protein DAPPUDRAFT_329527"
MSDSEDDFDPMFEANGDTQKANGEAKKANGEAKKANGEAKKPKAGGGGAKRLSVERIYQKKSQLEHILLRPDTYIGSVNPVTEKMWILDEENQRIVNKEITYVPGLYKIFDEILVNAADNKQRDKNMDTIKIDINREKNEIRVFNNGRGIPVEMHKDEKMFVPTLIFGHLLTSSNFNDEEEKVTGGRNGYGAKLCNVFSTKFTVETASRENRKEFKQVWENNMSKAKEAKLKDFSSGSDYTRITFTPDLPKFNMESLDADTVALLSRRAYDIAASSKGVKVFLNGKRIGVKNFKDYVDFFLKGHEDETGSPVKAIYEAAGERWEVAVAVSDNGFQQMSFVNSIATTKGGRHVDYVSKMIESNIAEVLKKKNKGGVTIKPHQIRNHLWLFINCLIVNPTFDSQTKENMTLLMTKFGSKCSFTPKFFGQLQKSGVVESVLAWSKFKADQEMKNKHSSKKTNKLKGILKLEDANDAGTKNSIDCTLILTEGDSAKTLAVAGLGVVGRDKFGVYPLRGKLLNVREATHKQIIENKEINEMVKIIGLTYKKKYSTVDDLKSLRYGKLMIMTDQDQDGSHIKGLLINFIHHNWPSLLRLPFLEEFITPIVKATKGSLSTSFFSLPELHEWKSHTDNWHTYKIKYYKGLGTSTSKEAKEYFSDMKRHQILFKHESDQDDHAINMAFSKKAIDQRKEWLTTWMEECKRRKELGLSEIYLYEKDTKTVSYSDFINKELVLFSNLDNERSIPSVVDGFKPGQRKVMFTCLKRNDKREVKVAQLAGSVGEMSAYHHGEASLMGTIINLAQNFVGSNNINLLLPIGQFGTRLAGGKDHASPRYIFTQMSPLTRLIFNSNDDAVLNYLTDDNQKIEPEWYMPIIPMVLVNGADGIGTGWMTKIPNYNPREIVRNLLNMIDGAEPEDMKPWFKSFKGGIESIENQRYVVNGEIASISENKIEVTELPVRSWTQSYKEQVMEPMLNGSEKIPAIIQDYKEYHTDVTVKFVVQMSADKLRQAELDKGLHQFFKLQTTISTSSMVLFDAKGCLRKYENVLEIMREFFHLRLNFYEKRKNYLEGMLEAESLKLSNQARFILEKCDGSLVVENKKRKALIEELQRKGFDSDPVKKWKNAQKMEEDSDSDSEGGLEKDLDYDYLLGMAMWSLTQERKDELLRRKDEKHQELRMLRGTSKEDLWRTDLKEFMEKLDEVEAKEIEDERVILSKESQKGAKGKKKLKIEALPSPVGIRVVPLIAEELKNKAAKAAAAKSRKGEKLDKKNLKEVEAVKDEFDFMCDDKDMNRSLSEKLGVSVNDKGAKKRGSDSSTPKKRPQSSPKTKGKKPWEDSDATSESDNSVEFDDFDDSGSDNKKSKSEPKSGSEVSDYEPEAKIAKNMAQNDIFNSSDDSDAPKVKRATAPAHKVFDLDDSDEDFDKVLKPSAPAAKRPSSDQKSEVVDSDDSDSPIKKKKRTISKAKKKVLDSDDDAPIKKPKAKKPKASPKVKKPPAAATKKSKKTSQGSDYDDSDEDDMFKDSDLSVLSVEKKVRGGVRRAAAQQKFTYSSDESDF